MTALDVGGRAPALPRLSRAVSPLVLELAAVALLMAWAVHARTRDLGAPLWIDEGISLGIADHGLTAIPHVLREDGAPPLFYVLLHGWTARFGATPRSADAVVLGVCRGVGDRVVPHRAGGTVRGVPASCCDGHRCRGNRLHPLGPELQPDAMNEKPSWSHS